MNKAGVKIIYKVANIDLVTNYFTNKTAFNYS